MDTEKSLCIVHTDLDGAMSYALINIFKGARIPVKALSQSELVSFWTNSIVNNITSYKKIYIFDLNIGDNATLFDHENVTIVDHHKASIKVKDFFQKAKTYLNDSTSTSMLLYKTLKQLKGKDFLTQQQKLLLLGVDDYDQYSLKIPFSRNLNYIFWSYTGDRVAKFYDEFKDGFKGFTEQQNNIIFFYKKRLEATLSELSLFETTIPYKDNNYKVISTFAEFATNDIAEYLITKFQADIAIIVNLKTQRVSFRKNISCPVNLDILAAKIASGGGHEAAAGGILNETFINFSKSLKPYEF